VFFPVLPKVRIQAIVHAACVGDIEHIAQNRPAPAVVNEGDTSGAAPDVPAHSLVPEVVFRAGGIELTFSDAPYDIVENGLVAETGLKVWPEFK
jgi:hypothetical protein